jgi:hypothetical protein
MRYWKYSLADLQKSEARSSYFTLRQLWVAVKVGSVIGFHPANDCARVLFCGDGM